MPFKPVQGNTDFAPTHNLEEDGPLVGTYVSTKENVGQYNKKVHTFAVAGGAEVQLWGSYRIDEVVDTIADENPPVIVRFTHQGKERTASGNTVNNIKAEISTDPADLGEASEVPAGAEVDDQDDV